MGFNAATTACTSSAVMVDNEPILPTLPTIALCTLSTVVPILFDEAMAP